MLRETVRQQPNNGDEVSPVIRHHSYHETSYRMVDPVGTRLAAPCAISGEEMARCRKIMRQGDANNRLEGIYRDLANDAIVAAFVRGKIEATDIVPRLTARIDPHQIEANYFYSEGPDSAVKNKLGAVSRNEAESLETSRVAARDVEIRAGHGRTGQFDAAYL
jgi:hypothetical protein